MNSSSNNRPWIASMLVLAAMLLLTSCFDPEPATVTVSCTFQGLQHICDVVLETPDGKVSRRARTNVRGIGEFKYLLPGDYVMKFVDARDNPWPAVRELSVRSGQVLPMRVELSEAETPQPKQAES